MPDWHSARNFLSPLFMSAKIDSIPGIFGFPRNVTGENIRETGAIQGLSIFLDVFFVNLMSGIMKRGESAITAHLALSRALANGAGTYFEPATDFNRPFENGRSRERFICCLEFKISRTTKVLKGARMPDHSKVGAVWISLPGRTSYICMKMHSTPLCSKANLNREGGRFDAVFET